MSDRAPWLEERYPTCRAASGARCRLPWRRRTTAKPSALTHRAQVASAAVSKMRGGPGRVLSHALRPRGIADPRGVAPPGSIRAARARATNFATRSRRRSGTASGSSPGSRTPQPSPYGRQPIVASSARAGAALSASRSSYDQPGGGSTTPCRRRLAGHTQIRARIRERPGLPPGLPHIGAVSAEQDHLRGASPGGGRESRAGAIDALLDRSALRRARR